MTNNKSDNINNNVNSNININSNKKNNMEIDNNDIDFGRISESVKKILYDYVAIGSFTDTAHEKEVEPFFMKLMSSFPYFKEHPEDYGLFEIPGDHLKRSVCWALVRGEGDDTVCMVHHYDVVGTEDFKTLKDYALLPDELSKRLKESPDMLSQEARADLYSEEYLFCKGGCDMKAGGSIQFSLLNEYGNLALKGTPLKGNVLVIAVPDEENLSAGMRDAATLLAKLKREKNLNYKIMINSEPHQRRNPEEGVFSMGTVGKLLPFVYVRGSMSHVGKVFEGLNPLQIISEIQRRTELNMEFSDTVVTGSGAAEASPPPTWIYLKDSKDVYDVSMPLNAYGCISVLTLTSSPSAVLKKIERICRESFETVIDHTKESYSAFIKNSKRSESELPWSVKVSSFDELLEEAERDHGEEFRKLYQNKKEEILNDFNSAKRDMINCNYELVSFIFDYVDDASPRIVYGLIPPYYPCVSNLEWEKKDKKIEALYDTLLSYTRENFNQEYIKEYFFSGICDLSYIDMSDPEEVRKSVSESMPLFGDFYDIPLEDIHDISMPGINIGPWGKDFHKLSERVLIEDVYHRTPRILDAAVKYLLE